MPVSSSPLFPPASVQAPDADTTFTRTIAFLTPMMGGGVEIKGTQKPCDPVTPIRVASIRGQLRFWWRACNPEMATTIADLRTCEGRLWGSTSNPSAVIITVTRQPGPPRLLEPDRAVAYGAFPLKPEQGSNAAPGKLHDFGKSTFTLTIRCPSGQREAVEEAILAWTTFGGLGGRTRRGFGALENVQRANPADLLRRLNDRPALGGVPSLSRARLEVSTRDWSTPHEAWSLGLSALQDFRQGEGTGRNRRAADSSRPGRSRWPEPDHIRRHFRQHAAGHEPTHTVQKFPRAAFGLPMIFHFSTRGDPEQKSITLRPRGRNRLASPLIIRPIRDGERFRAMALVLRVAGPDHEYELQVRDKWEPVQIELTSAEAKQIQPLHGDPSPLDAFLRHFSAKTKP